MTETDLKTYLEQSNCYDVESLTVAIGNITFTAAFYKQDRDPLPGARSQEPYTVEALYCLGNLPGQGHRYAYKIEGRLWYLACYSAENHTDKFFILMPCAEDIPLHDELSNRMSKKVYLFHDHMHADDDGEPVTSGAYRWAKRPLHSRRGWDKGCYAPQWNDGLMYLLPRGMYLPICTDRAGCERRQTKRGNQ